MFRIKICGVTSVEAALQAVDVGADALGLNFYPPSKRYLSLDTAQQVCQAVDGSCLRIGVFVNEATESMRSTLGQAGLDAVQLHGDESMAEVQSLSPIRVVYARRINIGSVELISQQLASAARKPDALLADAPAAGHYGGAGVALDWDLLAGSREWTQRVPLILAGGLNPDNVAQAIETVRPYGVDVASGVESSPGVKDPIKVRDFVQSAQQALAALG